MSCDFYAKKPKEIEFMLTATFTLEEWLKISVALKENNRHLSWPTSELTSSIESMSLQADRVFCPNISAETDNA